MATAIMHKTRAHPEDPTLIEAMEAMIWHMDRLAQEALTQADQEDAKRDEAIAAWLRGRGLSRHL